MFFSPPIWNTCSSNWIISPGVGVNIPKIFEIITELVVQQHRAPEKGKALHRVVCFFVLTPQSLQPQILTRWWFQAIWKNKFKWVHLPQVSGWTWKLCETATKRSSHQIGNTQCIKTSRGNSYLDLLKMHGKSDSYSPQWWFGSDLPWYNP